jgi:hypothetical protein
LFSTANFHSLNSNLLYLSAPFVSLSPTMPGEPGAGAAAAAEPLFRYSRAVGKLDALLPPNAAITTAVVHPRFLVRRVGASV